MLCYFTTSVDHAERYIQYGWQPTENFDRMHVTTSFDEAVNAMTTEAQTICVIDVPIDDVGVDTATNLIDQVAESQRSYGSFTITTRIAHYNIARVHINRFELGKAATENQILLAMSEHESRTPRRDR